MSYHFQVIFAAIRLTFAFVVIFGWVCPKILRYAGKQKGIDRIIYSWVGMGGSLLFVVFLLVNLNLYDFISLVFTLALLPLLYYILKKMSSGLSFSQVFKQVENKILLQQVRFFEQFGEFSLAKLKDKWLKKPDFSIFTEPYRNAALLLAAGATVIRMIPAVRNASPFTRSWYFELQAIKNLSLQEYFINMPTPKGMHIIVHIFSTLTQVSPEMILHITGSLISFFLTIIIFWVIRDITKGRYQTAALVGAGIYALFPVLFMPITFELQTTTSSLSMALCFAIPTAMFFLRNIRAKFDVPYFYITMGIIATGLTDLFVFLMVLLPFMSLSLLASDNKYYFRLITKNLGYIIGLGLLTLIPYYLFCVFNEISFQSFLIDQLFDSSVFSFNPKLITDIESLSIYYLYAGLILGAFYILKYFIQKDENMGNELIFIILFCLVSYVYTPYFSYDYILIDPDQLNSFYSILIAIFFGIIFYSAFIFLEWLISNRNELFMKLSVASSAALGIILIIIQGGVEISRVLPQTLPNGFFQAYYSIISDHLPYSYATVGPEIDRSLAKNRHFFMNYDYFLNNYGVIDSLYQQYLLVEDFQRESEEVPPASIFIFVEKPPYGSIQQGILYDSPNVMRDMEQWLNSFRELENRQLEVFYENENSVIYEIVNREGESGINQVLLNMYPEKEGRAKKITK